MSYTFKAGAQLGSRYAGAAIGYRLVNDDGTEFAAWTDDGVTEAAVPGDYSVTGYLTFNNTFLGRIEWGLDGETPLAGEAIVPPLTDEYLKARIYGAVGPVDHEGRQVFYAAGDPDTPRVRFSPTTPRGGRTVELDPEV